MEDRVDDYLLSVVLGQEVPVGGAAIGAVTGMLVAVFGLVVRSMWRADNRTDRASAVVAAHLEDERDRAWAELSHAREQSEMDRSERLQERAKYERLLSNMDNDLRTIRAVVALRDAERKELHRQLGERDKFLRD